MANFKIIFAISTNQKCFLGNQFWEINFLQNQLTDNSALKESTIKLFESKYFLKKRWKSTKQDITPTYTFS